MKPDFEDGMGYGDEFILVYMSPNHLIFEQIPVDISHILGNLITVIFDYQILRKPLKILSL